MHKSPEVGQTRSIEEMWSLEQDKQSAKHGKMKSKDKRSRASETPRDFGIYSEGGGEFLEVLEERSDRQ